MQQVVDLQNDPKFQALDIELLSVSPDPVDAWRSEGGKLGIRTPMLSDDENLVWLQYGVVDWMMTMSNEPGHTFVLVGKDGQVAWVKDYGAAEHGGLMYVSPDELVPQLNQHLKNP
jgi:peroxiredoxin